ncbi:MAG: hypothetical protein R3F30_13080 [Planctomycetota bacterium]
MKVVRTRRGARLVQGGAVLSEILARPGPTDTLFDLLATLVARLAPGPRVGLLGFAGGGVVAPIRALGFGGPLEAVDLSLEAVPLFKELSRTWCGRVRVHKQEACSWLRGQPRFDLLLEDLSIEGPEGETKPPATWTRLPRLMRRRLGTRGIAIVNLLPVPGMSWSLLTEAVSAPFEDCLVVELTDYENRVLVLGGELPAARELGRDLRDRLRGLGSDQADKVRVRQGRSPRQRSGSRGGKKGRSAR